MSFFNFSCMFPNPIIFFNLNYDCSNSLEIRNLQEQVKKAFCDFGLKKLIWIFTVWINCSSDLAFSFKFQKKFSTRSRVKLQLILWGYLLKIMRLGKKVSLTRGRKCNKMAINSWNWQLHQIMVTFYPKLNGTLDLRTMDLTMDLTCHPLGGICHLPGNLPHPGKQQPDLMAHPVKNALKCHPLGICHLPGNQKPDSLKKRVFGNLIWPSELNHVLFSCEIWIINR